MRRFARVDSNQAEVVKALRQIGCSVQSLATIGAGCPDLLVGYHGENFLLEIKRDDGPPSGKNLTEAQVVWDNAWRGNLACVHTSEEAIRYVLASGR